MGEGLGSLEAALRARVAVAMSGGVAFGLDDLVAFGVGGEVFTKAVAFFGTPVLTGVEDFCSEGSARLGSLGPGGSGHGAIGSGDC